MAKVIENVPILKWIPVAWANLKLLVRAARDAERLRESFAQEERIRAAAEENYSLRLERQTLEGRIRELESALKTRTQMRFSRNAYWSGDGFDEVNGPFCPACFDTKGLVVRMSTWNRRTVAGCPSCKVQENIQEYKPGDPPPDPPRSRIRSRGL